MPTIYNKFYKHGQWHYVAVNQLQKRRGSRPAGGAVQPTKVDVAKLFNTIEKRFSRLNLPKTQGSGIIQFR